MNKIELKKIFVFIGLLILGISIAYAATSNVPTSPVTINQESSGRYSGTSNLTMQAEAGNVTELSITDKRITLSWQGYFGNITGTITLDDGNNYTLYDWNLPSPNGEIYASNGSSVSWPDLKCVNLSSKANGDGWTMNMTTLENAYNITSADFDGIDETFNSTYANTTGFLVGGIQINNLDSCPMANTYVNEAHQSLGYREVLLTDNQSIIFTALLENSLDGFKTGTDLHDFQMLVAENGHPGYESTTTPYWFYVELS